MLSGGDSQAFNVRHEGAHGVIHVDTVSGKSIKS